MPTVQNQRHERFAQEVAKGKSSTDAYIAAGYDVDATVARAAAARLLANVSVKARVEELKEQIAAAVVEETGIDRMEVLRHLGRIATAPLGDKDVSPSVKRAALMDYAKIEGWVIERSEVGQPGDFSKLSDEELRKRLCDCAAECGLTLVEVTDLLPRKSRNK